MYREVQRGPAFDYLAYVAEIMWELDADVEDYRSVVRETAEIMKYCEIDFVNVVIEWKDESVSFHPRLPNSKSQIYRIVDGHLEAPQNAKRIAVFKCEKYDYENCLIFSYGKQTPADLPWVDGCWQDIENFFLEPLEETHQ